MTDAVKKAEEMLQRGDFIQELGIELTELTKDSAIGRIPFDEKKRNPGGTMHGGCLFALADTIAGTLAFNNAGYVVTVEGSLHFLAAAAGTRYVYCKAALKRCGKSIITVSVDLTDDEGMLLDTGCFTYYRAQ